jgi:hypothetical protein
VHNVVKGWLVNATARHENYSDFGAANVWKLSSSVNAIEDDKLTLEDLFQQDLERLHYTKFILKISINISRWSNYNWYCK